MLMQHIMLQKPNKPFLLCPRRAGIKWWCASDLSVCLSVAYIGPKSRTEKHRKTTIATKVAHATIDSDTTFKVKRSKIKVTCESGAYCGGLPHSLLYYQWHALTKSENPCSILPRISQITRYIEPPTLVYFLMHLAGKFWCQKFQIRIKRRKVNVLTLIIWLWESSFIMGHFVNPSAKFKHSWDLSRGTTGAVSRNLWISETYIWNYWSILYNFCEARADDG